MQADWLAGRVALVNGGGTDLGQAVALALAEAGAAVAVGHVNPTQADAVADAILACGGRARGWAADPGNKFQVAALIEQLRDEFEGLHLVVNVWFVNKQTPFLTLDEYDWRRVIEMNLTGAFFLTQLAARVMADEDGGHILHVVPRVTTENQTPAFAASCAAVKAFSAAVDAALAPQVRVSTLEAQSEPAQTVRAVLETVRHMSH
ncbi:MAG: hypothetical protein Kow0077_08660 [Anaerolineae bacterium]